jgi:nitric oxide reductase activation protein
VDRYQEKKRNFSWIKVVATHQTGHLEFNSFGLVFERPSSLFQDLRWEVEKDGNGLLPRGASDEEPNGSTIATDMGRFFGLFEERQLALDVFTAVEDSRLDHRIKAEYPGLASTYSQAQKEALAERPSVEMLPLRQALIELLIRLSLDQHERSPVPKDYVREVNLLFSIMARLRNIEAAVEDSAEATLRVYAILARLPNEKIDPAGWEYQDADMSQEYSEEEFKDLMEELAQRQGEAAAGNGEEVPYDSPEEVDFRGGFKPEMVQILSQLRMLRPDEVSKEELEELLKQSVELETGSEETQPDGELQELVQNLMKEAGKDLDRNEEGRGDGPIGHVEEQGGPLDAQDDLTAAYDEWDFRAGDYKPRWCMVHERRIEEGDSRFFEGVLKEYASLMSEIKRQFEMVSPEQLRRIRRVEDGEDLELDAAIEAEIDRRLGSTPSEKVYWRRNKVERDVAVAFLVDMSASTAEAVEETRGKSDLSGAPPGPAASVQRQQKSGGRRNYKRIIDLEKESTALLIQALETIGDTYGIYGFSGYGRENVEFYVIKDVSESYSDKVKKRLDKMSPLHATRMGPAIRHAIDKLEKQESKTKFLFLISDGRPQDRGYSREGVERDYAVHDTHMALLEARQKGITPFCLTVDKNGHDYLKAMCGDMGYEVLTDIYALPRRLPMLYKSLTV